jgi:hypothetical protein
MLMTIGCQKNKVEKPEKLINEETMVDILYDLAILDAVKSQNISETENSINTGKYIYNKYKIDSLQFVQNNKYYATQIDDYKKMYESVKRRLEQKMKVTDSLLIKSGEIPPSSYYNGESDSDIPQIK